MARKTQKQKDAEAAAAEAKAKAEAEAANEGTDADAENVNVETNEGDGAESEGAEANEGDGAEGDASGAAGEDADKKYVGDYTAEQWEALSPAEKVQFMKEKAKAAAKKSQGTPGRSRSGQETIGSVACDAIREGLTNDEVLARVYEKFPSARTSIASVTWYRNSLKSAGENIMNSREIKAKRAAEAKAAAGGEDPPAGATDAELNPNNEMGEGEAEDLGGGEDAGLSQEELDSLIG